VQWRAQGRRRFTQRVLHTSRPRPERAVRGDAAGPGEQPIGSACGQLSACHVLHAPSAVLLRLTAWPLLRSCASGSRSRNTTTRARWRTRRSSNASQGNSLNPSCEFLK